MNGKELCRVKNCHRPVAYMGFSANGQQLCSAHFQRLRRTGKLMEDKPILEKHRGCNLNEDGSRKKCQVKGCNMAASSRGHCHMHWKRKVRNDGEVYTGVPSGKLRLHKSEYV